MKKVAFYSVAVLAGTFLRVECSMYAASVGVGLVMSSVIFGQLTMSMIIEHNGWLVSPINKVKKKKIIVLTLMLVSLSLIYF